MANAKALVTTAASVAASAMLIRSIANELLPWQVHNFLSCSLENLSRRFSSQHTIVIEEFEGFSKNQVFEAAEIYLGSISNPLVQRFRVSKGEKENDLAVSIDRNEEMIDVFENVHLKWRLITTQVQSSRNSQQNIGDLNSTLRSEIRFFELSFHKKHKEKVLKSYFPHILERSKAIREERKSVKINTYNENFCRWEEIDLNHPMTFASLAIDLKLKMTLLEDLEKFMNGKEYYKRIGKAWKRGYLLYGPPGTGKSSLIGAMANHLNFNIYDLDLTNVFSNTDLGYMLMLLSNRSILVIEDIDCAIKLQNLYLEAEPYGTENDKVTLSGLLNLIDGLMSCCREGQIVVFTTNYKERLDPALLRPGRMDMHICLSYCNHSVFEQLVFNYLGLRHHYLFDEIGRLISQTEVTPAEVAGELMKSMDAQVSLQGLLNFLHKKRNEQDK